MHFSAVNCAWSEATGTLMFKGEGRATGDGGDTRRASPFRDECKCRFSGNVEVAVGVRIGDETAFRTVSGAKTDQSKMLKVTIPVPDEARAGQEIAFVVETVNGRVRLVSDPFEIGS